MAGATRFQRLPPRGTAGGDAPLGVLARRVGHVAALEVLEPAEDVRLDLGVGADCLFVGPLVQSPDSPRPAARCAFIWVGITCMSSWSSVAVTLFFCISSRAEMVPSCRYFSAIRQSFTPCPGLLCAVSTSTCSRR
ncbi:hypothetical protein PG994_013926 [Apiospora phragmitis]|uniref:Indole-3-glycerol-phosphate synthase n=1 Tax=Apiospora phragmitis TaxID=2905665 RepID=A0ABR1T2X2_9PEZI